MLLARRFLIAGPLAVAVALLAHAAIFGHAHAVAGAAEPGLVGSVSLALGILFGATVVAAAFAGRRSGFAGSGRTPGSEGSTGFRSSLWSLSSLGAQLAAGAALTLGTIECAEGHGLWVLTSGSALAVLPLGAFVAIAARAASRWATRLGIALAATVLGSFEGVVRFGILPRRLAPALVSVTPRRGRAPPR